MLICLCNEPTKQVANSVVQEGQMITVLFIHVFLVMLVQVIEFIFCHRKVHIDALFHNREETMQDMAVYIPLETTGFMRSAWQLAPGMCEFLHIPL